MSGHVSDLLQGTELKWQRGSLLLDWLAFWGTSKAE